MIVGLMIEEETNMKVVQNNDLEIEIKKNREDIKINEEIKIKRKEIEEEMMIMGESGGGMILGKEGNREVIAMIEGKKIDTDTRNSKKTHISSNGDKLRKSV
jgi:ABC-type microcin C transport system duplicated ATPase subunit YejF